MTTEIQSSKITPVTGLLDHLLQKAITAHNGTSFSPEKRGASLINEVNEELNADINMLKDLGVMQLVTAEYAAKYESKVIKWLNKKSRCISSMITGPARFPVARAEKFNNAEHNAYQELQAFRKAFIAGCEKRHRKEAVEAAGGALEIAKKKLASLKESQQFMKDVNAAYRAFKKKPESLEKSKLSDKTKELIKAFVPQYSYEPNPFPAYKLTNNTAVIKNTKDRIAELEQKDKFVAAAEQNEYPFEGGRVEICAADDRIRIYHDQKPAAAKILQLKSCGFKWSPFNVCWQRQITENARRATSIVTGITI